MEPDINYFNERKEKAKQIYTAQKVGVRRPQFQTTRITPFSA
jgi:hypothetical protein